MSHTLLRFLIVGVVVSACGRTETANGTVAKATDGASATASAPATSVGLTPGAVPRDSISDRADRGRIFGDTTASVWLIMASDFQCPYCKSWHHGNFAGIMKDYVNNGRIRIAFLNYPLQQHQNAIPAAEAAMCGSVQNKFWPIHDGLFMTQEKWQSLRNATPLFDSLAMAAGVNMALFRECMSKHLTRALIEADHDRAANVGVKSTPTFIVGSKVMMGADQPVRAALDSALAKAGPKKPGT